MSNDFFQVGDLLSTPESWLIVLDDKDSAVVEGVRNVTFCHLGSFRKATIAYMTISAYLGAIAGYDYPVRVVRDGVQIFVAP